MNSQFSVNINTVITELDYLLSKNQYSEACDFLEKHIYIAEQKGDKKAAFSLSNECIGIFRKMGNKEKCYAYCEKAITLTETLKLENSVAGATAFVNCATAKKAFDDASESIIYFEKAQEIYETLLPEDDKRLAGLYNNFALSLVDLKIYDKALELYRNALTVLNKASGNDPEKAITYLNMANAVENKLGLENACEEIDEFLDKATELLDKNISLTDGNYAFVCEKCASTFGYYGRFFYEAQLKERANKIYERS